ncbi:unnamed protein product [Oikopleura dioica]|uniref:Superoxide dismutase copper/zinc binding domain-containing protein n=1 Tax=Oikopleura dioica TaxID=34765 RepID=E4X0C3_OIKDI|nr:unnamed protein product [Oikopleura dioica]
MLFFLQSLAFCAAIEVNEKWFCDFSEGHGDIKGRITIYEKEETVPNSVNVTYNEVHFEGKLKSTNENVQSGEFGFHVHESAFLDDEGGAGICSTAGGHFSDGITPHGPKNETANNRHFGDLGNVEFVKGVLELKIKDDLLSLQINEADFFGNKSIVIHDKIDTGIPGDDLGKRVGCCNVKKSNGQKSLLSATILILLAYSLSF